MIVPNSLPWGSTRGRRLAARVTGSGGHLADPLGQDWGDIDGVAAMRDRIAGHHPCSPGGEQLLKGIAREEASLNQYQHNIDSLKGRLSAAETNLQAGSDTLLEMRDLLLWAANRGANSDEDLGSMAGELSTLEETFVSYLNVRDEEGRYYFSGTMTDQPAVRAFRRPSAGPTAWQMLAEAFR